MQNMISGIVLSEASQKALAIAQAIAKENRNASFTPAHLLKALMHRDTGLQTLMKQLDKDVYYFEEWADVRIESLAKSTSLPAVITGSAEIEEAANEADSIRLKLAKDTIEPLHLLAALSTPGVCFSYEQLKSYPLRREELMNTVVRTEEFHSVIGKNDQSNAAGTAKENFALLKYCIDKTQQQKGSSTDTIVGRDKEIRMMMEILCRRSKPNVLITGEPGVGKTALIDGFVQAIAKGKVAAMLLNARVFELDGGALVSGASYKGEIEDRLKSIVSEISQFDKAILFVDEIHTLIDKTGTAGNVLSVLKPELARGSITIIGATTQEEYRKIIQPDEALSRRFELLQVEEPDSELCFNMLKAVIPQYESHHALSVADATIKESIRLSKRYNKDRRLPDAAIDLLDRSMSALQMMNDTGSRDLEEFDAVIDDFTKDTACKPSLEEAQWLHVQMKQKLSPVLWAYLETDEDPSAMTDPDAIICYLKEAVSFLKNVLTNPRTEVTKTDIAATISYKTGIPIGKVSIQERERLLQMEAMLRKRVIGQGNAVKAVSDAILESRSGLNKPGQPIGSFFFMGPTGTGKTELTKALSEFLFQDESAIIRFDMSEFKEEHAAALLYGAPPGYVGYEEGGLLVNKIRQKPYTVVLFDEIEKAHASVFDVFLQIMDEGKLHDKLGKEGDFSNALIIFTSNIGSHYVQEAVGRGEIPASNKLMEIMADHFRPEFLGRLTEIVPFVPMTLEMVQHILQIQLKSLRDALQKKGIELIISDAAMTTLAHMGYTPQYGARPLSGVIRTQLRRPLSRKIIKGEIGQGSYVLLDIDINEQFRWTIEQAIAEQETVTIHETMQYLLQP